MINELFLLRSGTNGYEQVTGAPIRYDGTDIVFARPVNIFGNLGCDGTIGANLVIASDLQLYNDMTIENRSFLKNGLSTSVRKINSAEGLSILGDEGPQLGNLILYGNYASPSLWSLEVLDTQVIQGDEATILTNLSLSGSWVELWWDLVFDDPLPNWSVTLYVYSDSEKTQLVSQGSLAFDEPEHPLVIVLNEQGGSGVNGQVDFSPMGDTDMDPDNKFINKKADFLIYREDATTIISSGSIFGLAIESPFTIVLSPQNGSSVSGQIDVIGTPFTDNDLSSNFIISAITATINDRNLLLNINTSYTLILPECSVADRQELNIKWIGSGDVTGTIFAQENQKVEFQNYIAFSGTEAIRLVSDGVNKWYKM